MDKMTKIPGVIIDLIFAAFGISNLVAMGADYRHIFAAFSGSLLVTTFLDKGKWDKVWFAFGGFSFACFVGPWICEWQGCDSHSPKCIAIYFASGLGGMLLVQMLITILNETRAYIPDLVKVAVNGLKLFLRKWLNINSKNDVDSKDI